MPSNFFFFFFFKEKVGNKRDEICSNVHQSDKVKPKMSQHLRTIRSIWRDDTEPVTIH